VTYEKLIRINELNFSNKKVVIIGAGWMADQYCQALQAMGIRSVTVVSRKEESARRCCQKYGYQPRHGGYQDVLPKLVDASDLLIIATPIHELRAAAEFATSLGYKNILVEKPGALYSDALRDWAQSVDKQDVKIRLAFNRHTYPSFWKLKELSDNEGGITSCHYMFTEWVHTINFKNNHEDVYRRWGVSNSLHVIAMAHALIGMPHQISTYRNGGFDWHPSGERFAGAGITESGVLFSYHADWKSAGRWGIEIMTSQNAYRLIPLEKLFRCPKGSVNWEPVEIMPAFSHVKEGVAEELALMLDDALEKSISAAVTLADAARYVKLAESLFGYTS
jgi:predicted dehydrogenase